MAAALAGFDADPTSGYPEVLAELSRSRLLAPVVAVLGEVEYDENGLAHDKTSDMATVLVQAPDGRTALLAFTSTETMARWDPRARPVPATTSVIARAARQDGASVIVVDIAGPVRYVVAEQDLDPLAQGLQLLRLGDELAWVG